MHLYDFDYQAYLSMKFPYEYDLMRVEYMRLSMLLELNNVKLEQVQYVMEQIKKTSWSSFKEKYNFVSMVKIFEKVDTETMYKFNTDEQPMVIDCNGNVVYGYAKYYDIDLQLCINYSENDQEILKTLEYLMFEFSARRMLTMDFIEVHEKYWARLRED